MQHGAEHHDGHSGISTAVIEVSGVQWATEKAVVESVLGRRPGVLGVEANPVAQTATVTYDSRVTSVPELASWVRDCGYHCRGLSIPEHICDPLADPRAALAHPAEHPHPAEHAHPVESGARVESKASRRSPRSPTS